MAIIFTHLLLTFVTKNMAAAAKALAVELAVVAHVVRQMDTDKYLAQAELLYMLWAEIIAAAMLDVWEW